MFETIQPESNASSGTGKIVAGVIVVVLVAFGVLYFTYLRQEPAPGAASQSAAAPTPAAMGDETAEPLRDLQILKYNLGRDQQTQTMAMWDIQLANRSRAFTYRNIEYATNYYDASDNLLYSNTGTISQPLEPMGQQAFSRINDGLYPVGTVRYTIQITGAEAVPR